MKAFPRNLAKGQIIKDEGMDLRDYFAAKAMQGLLSNTDWTANSIDDIEQSDSIPRLAYSVADAMMEARND